ncbi:MAG: polyprenyl synthetase family protein [Clostridiales bacterium]|nr:polyprenyl synthetase family protein [Clostridiales bacterium]
MDFRTELTAYQEKIEAYLERCFTGEPPYGELYTAMRYSLLAGGKRIRPVLTMAFCQAAGGDGEQALPFAAAIEMVHTYSLIHDDLPCMDNDDLRRGRPTNHKVFGECMAVLAGDALQAAAFEQVLSAPLPQERRLTAALILAREAGQDGMCAGQVLDMQGEQRSLSPEEITRMNALKTGCLLEAACLMGVTAAGGSSEQMQAAREYAAAVGLAFQIRDDILDMTATSAEMGKTVGKDAAQGKSTLVSLQGVEQAERTIQEQTRLAKRALKETGLETTFLEALADYLAGRSN